MTLEQVEKKLIELAARTAGAGARIDRGTRFDWNGLNFDSLDSVEFVMDVECEFDISVPDADAERIKTIGEAADYVWRRVPGGAAAKVE